MSYEAVFLKLHCTSNHMGILWKNTDFALVGSVMDLKFCILTSFQVMADATVLQMTWDSKGWECEHQKPQSLRLSVEGGQTW